jgi:hypothetical protein
MPFDAEHFTTELPLIERDPKSITDPRERLMYLRDFLRRLPSERFDMNYFAYSAELDSIHVSAEQVRAGCGTTACIAGWCEALFTDNLDVHGTTPAQGLLGLSDGNSSSLFYANDTEDGRLAYWDATPTQAANVLDNLLKTGVVDWGVA